MSPRRMEYDRAQEIVARAWRADTLQAIADDYGISRERVRQILAEHGGPTGDELRRLRRERDAKTVEEALATGPFYSLEEIGDATNLAPSRVAKILGESRYEVLEERVVPNVYSDDVILNSLRQASKRAKGKPLTVAAYKSMGLKPGPATIVRRFSSWHRACNAAGVEAGAHRGPQEMWSEEELVQWLSEFLSEPALPRTMSAYEKWRASAHPDAPSAYTYTKRFGGWAEAKRNAGD